MSTSEIAFLALGLALGAALVVALAQLGYVRPVSRREVRLTITPNAIPARRARTLAVPNGTRHPGLIPGSPDADALLDGATSAPAAGHRLAPDEAPAAAASRTRVPSPAVVLPATVIGVPVGGARMSAPDAPLASTAAVAAVMSARRRSGPARDDSFTMLVQPRRPAEKPTPSPASGGVAVAAPSPARSALHVATRAGVTRAAFAAVAGPAPSPQPGATPASAHAAPGPEGAADPVPGSVEPGASAGPCAGPRRAVEERCALAGVAGEQASRAADSLREAQRAYDILREKVDRAHDQADPRNVAEAKDRLHATFRAATDRATDPEQTEAAARAWLDQINALNNAVRDARRTIEAGTAELRERLPALERLAAEADAARIAGENAEAGCREAREELAACEEASTRARDAVPPVAEDPHPFANVWPSDSPNLPAEPAPAARMAGLPAIVRVLRGDRDARERLVATLGADDAESRREWQLRISRLVDAIGGRAIEDGYLDLPGDDPFWRLFDTREAREIVAALSALGFRYDGMGGFADGRVPATRDLSLAVGYAGLDRMRIRTWPRDAEIAALYARAIVASDEWLADQAGDLSLGRMVDALGGRAADLADLWNAWGRIRPALLAP